MRYFNPAFELEVFPSLGNLTALNLRLVMLFEQYYAKIKESTPKFKSSPAVIAPI